MDPEKEDLKKTQQQDDKDVGNLLKRGRDLFEKKTNQFSMLLRRGSAIIVAVSFMAKLIITIVAIALLTTFISAIDDTYRESKTADAAAMNVINNEVTLTNEIGGNGYYFKINDDILDKYIEESYHISQKDDVDIFPDDDEEEEENDYEEREYDEYEEEREQENEQEVENDYEERDYNEYNDYDEEEEEKRKQKLEDWFKTREFKEYFIKMIRAEITSTYPKLGEYTGEDGTEDKQKNKKDKNGDYVAQGIVQIHRQKIKEDGTVEAEEELTYLPYESDDPNVKTFKGLINANDTEALDHFSFNEKTGQIYYATYKKEVVTVNGVEDTEQGSYKIVESPPVSYKSLTAMCNMPYSFLFSLLQTSKNPDYVMAVADLLLEKSTVILMIQDQLNINEYTEVNRQAEKTKEQELTGHEETYIIGNTIGTDTYWSYGPINTSYEFPAGEEETIVRTTYENTVNIYVKEAETWCMDFEQEATQDEPDITEGEITEVTHEESEYKGLKYPSDPTESNRDSMPEATDGATFTIIEKFLSDEKLVYTTKVDNTSYNFTVDALTEKRINYERFVGLWKNDKGVYYDGCLFDENNPRQKDVRYPTPDDDRKLDIVVDNIADHQGQTIDGLTNLLAVNGNEAHERLMKYFWNKYYGEDVYDVDISDLLDLFSTQVVKSASGSGYGSLPINWNNGIGREEFIECMNNSNFAKGKGAANFTGEMAGKIWDICTQNNINPVLCVAQAAIESGWGNSIGASYNYWGLGVFTDKSSGYGYASMEKAVEYWVSIMMKYQEAGSMYNSMIMNNGARQYNTNKYSSSVMNIYDVAVIYCGLPSPHGSSCYGGSSKDLIRTILNMECTHTDNMEITDEEQSAYDIWYGDKVISCAVSIFGSQALNLAGLAVAEDEPMLELQKELAAKVGMSAEAETMSLDKSSCVTFSKYNSQRVQAVKSVGAQWYGSGDNHFNAAHTFQCTWWAFGRASEYLGHKFSELTRGDAKTWWNAIDADPNIKNGTYTKSQTPRAGAVVIWGSGTWGHVAFVEGVSADGQYVYISHSGGGTHWNGVTKLAVGEMPRAYGTLLGYIYLD